MSLEARYMNLEQACHARSPGSTSRQNLVSGSGADVRTTQGQICVGQP